jgi:hypothetical protein
MLVYLFAVSGLALAMVTAFGQPPYVNNNNPVLRLRATGVMGCTCSGFVNGQSSIDNGKQFISSRRLGRHLLT